MTDKQSYYILYLYNTFGSKAIKIQFDDLKETSNYLKYKLDFYPELIEIFYYAWIKEKRKKQIIFKLEQSLIFRDCKGMGYNKLISFLNNLQ